MSEFETALALLDLAAQIHGFVSSTPRRVG